MKQKNYKDVSLDNRACKSSVTCDSKKKSSLKCWLKENKDHSRTIICKILVAKCNKPDWNELVKYSRFRHNTKQASFTSPTGPRRQGDEQEHAQYLKNHSVTSGWSCRRPENVSILSSLLPIWAIEGLLEKNYSRSPYPIPTVMTGQTTIKKMRSKTSFCVKAGNPSKLRLHKLALQIQWNTS